MYWLSKINWAIIRSFLVTALFIGFMYVGLTCNDDSHMLYELAGMPQLSPQHQSHCGLVFMPLTTW